LGEFPNKATQFSSTYRAPNNHGRPKGSFNLKKAIRLVFENELTDPKTGGKVVAGLLAVKAMVNKALDGDVAAFKTLAERLEGMPTQKVDQTTTHKTFYENIIHKAGEDDSE
jgi:ABC-type sulfate transport system substrate-binding protein